MSINPHLELLTFRRTKIVATVGPRSRNAATIRGLIETGVDVFRLNMSHGIHADHAEAIAHIRAGAAACRRHVGILADLCGPKIRTGRFAGAKVELSTGTRVVVTTRDVLGTAALIPSQYAALPSDVRLGDRVLLNDGAVELVVRDIAGTDVTCEVVSGGEVGDYKGINLPGVNVSAPSMSARDIEDARFALAQRVDFIALSFVRTADDMTALRALTEGDPNPPALIAKIEKPEALENIHEIIRAADGVMVARGDLGVELNAEQVPHAQNALIHLARVYDKPVIVATQMLESMISHARPTRAEVTDVSCAVAEGTDAIMLSGETAVGEYPLEAVGMMVRIAHQTEAYQIQNRNAFSPLRVDRTQRVAFGDAIAHSVAQLAIEIGASAVVVISMKGMTATTVSAARPVAPIVAITRYPETGRRLSLLWGVIPYVDPAVGDENPNQVARRVATTLGLVKPDDFIIVVRGFNADPTLNTPTITLLKI